MKLFGNKNEETNTDATHDEAVVATAPEKAAPKTPAAVDGKENLAYVLQNPRITEKATMGIERRVYVFDVAPGANKMQVKKAVKQVYNVEPQKVHVATVPRKTKRSLRTGIKGRTAIGKKAYVYLKEGDSISVM